MNFNRLMLAALGSIIGFCSITSQAEAVIVSVKTFGMAATGVAYPQDALAGAFNPAGPVEIGDRMDLGITWGHDEGSARIKGNLIPPFLVGGGAINGKYRGYKTKDSYSPDFGINKRLGCDNEWAIGLVAYNRNYSKTTYNRPFLLLGTSKLGLEYVHETISPVLAYKINDQHNIGISVNYMVQRVKVTGLENFDNAFRSVAPGHVTNREYDYSTGVGFTLGWQWHITDCITFGLTYQPETSMSRFHKYKGFFANRGKFNIPTTYSGGIAWRFIECATIAFDIQRYQWTDIRALHNPIEHDGTIELLGSKHGPGFGFKSQTFYRLGVDYALNEQWTVRAGYRYGNTPIRATQTVVNQLTLDTVEHFITVGATYAINECHEVSSFFAYGFRNNIDGKHSIPEGIPPTGFGGGNSNLDRTQLALGLSWGWNY